MKTLFILIIILAFCCPANAQLPLIDRGIQAEGLWCFPLHGDSNRYVYLPYQSEMAMSEDGQLPQFSFMRYVIARQATGSGADSALDEGGGLLNFLVLYNTPQEKVAAAEKIIRQRLKNDSIRIRGPLVFERGRYSLVSSVINEDASRKKQILSAGNAPVLENSQVALSFGLTPVASSILNENFKMSTPDVSLVFDMEFSGLTEDYDAVLDIDWSEVKKSNHFNAGVNVYFISANVKLAFDDLFKTQAIKLTVNGSNESMDALLHVVYEKLLNLMFQPVQPEQLPPQQQQGLMSMLNEGVSSLASSNTVFSAQVGYQLKEMKTTGASRLVFKGKSTVQRHHFITFNIGDLHRKWGSNKNIFTDRVISPDAFSQRKVVVGIDGELEKEFEKILNSVTVFMSKEHRNGNTTSQNLLINKDSRNTSPAFYYGYQEDTTGWMQYRYRSVWQFKGGASYQSDWQAQDASMINLYVPFSRREIHLEGDMTRLQQQDIRAISVQIRYPFFSESRHDRITVSTSQPLTDKWFHITQPNDQAEIDYTITWIKNNGVTIEKKGKDKVGIIFIDELPR